MLVQFVHTIKRDLCINVVTWRDRLSLISFQNVEIAIAILAYPTIPKLDLQSAIKQPLYSLRELLRVITSKTS